MNADKLGALALLAIVVGAPLLAWWFFHREQKRRAAECQRDEEGRGPQ